MPISSNMSSLFVVSETCKQSSREDRWCQCEATFPGCFLFPKSVNKAAGRTGCACVKQVVLVVCCFRKHVNKAAERTGCAYVKQVVLFVCCFRKHVNKAAGRTGGASVKQLVLIV